MQAARGIKRRMKVVTIAAVSFSEGPFKVGDVLTIGTKQYKILGFERPGDAVVRRTFKQWAKDIWAAVRR